MNQQTQYFWKLMNKYGLNKNGDFFHWLDKYNGTGKVQVCDYNGVIHWFKKNMKAIKKEQTDWPMEMPGTIQKHQAKYKLRFFKRHFNPNNHNLYLYFYLESLGYLTFHTMTKFDAVKLENKMRIFKHLSWVSSSIYLRNYSVIKHLPKYVKDELKHLGNNYIFPTKTGKPYYAPNYVPTNHPWNKPD